MKDALHRRLPSASMAVALLALVVALGGSAYAVKKLKAGSVKTKTIKNAAVTTPKLASDAVNSAKLGDGVVVEKKIKNQAVTAAKLAPGAVPEIQRAYVDATGTDGPQTLFDASSGTVTAIRSGLGTYYVTFPTSLAKQGLLASVGDTAGVPVVISASRCGGGPGGVTCPAAQNNASTAQVGMYDVTGVPAGYDANFTVVGIP